MYVTLKVIVVVVTILQGVDSELNNTKTVYTYYKSVVTLVYIGYTYITPGGLILKVYQLFVILSIPLSI